MPGPYRHVSATETVEALTRRGRLRLEIAPRHVQLEIEGVFQLVVHENFLTWVDLQPEPPEDGSWWMRRKRRKPKKRSLRLDEGQLLVARSFQTEELSLWFEERPGIYRRLFGIEPVYLLDAPALQAWKDLERLSKRLAVALGAFAREARAVTEFGRGHHRIILVDYDRHSEVCARPVFRERQRPVFRAYRDGTVVNLKGKGQRGTCVSRYSVTLGGDRIRFDQLDGERAAELHLPWISPEDREELAQRLRMLVDGAGARDRAATESDAKQAPSYLAELAQPVPGNG